jgi:hypothetical protein
MGIVRNRSSAALLLACAAGCAGNGNGLDQNGNTVSSSSGSVGSITADFQSIQDNVFTPICSKCHIGASAPEGLQLDAAHSYNLLVGVPSNEQPSVLRVKPSDPDDSYMVHKIEGLAGISGGQMPLGETPLPQATIDAIRQWITNGAPNAATAARVFALETTAPLDKATVNIPVARVVVTFTQDVDASLVNETSITLEKIADESGATPGAVGIGASRTVAANNAAVLLITPRKPLEPGTYRVIVHGVGAAAIANLRGMTLGADTSFEFTVEAAP